MPVSNLEITSKLQISKSPAEVFDAIIDPARMSNYFISESTGSMEGGKKLEWKFPEFDQHFPVTVEKTDKPEFISFRWGDTGKETLVEIRLRQGKENNTTVVEVTEKSHENNESGIKWLKSNTEGWANFLACLKAWLEYGINLRKGAFDFMKD